MLGFDLRKIAQMHRFSHQFEDLGKIGSGGFSQVRKVRHRMDMRLYAAKIVSIKPSLKSQDENQQKIYRFLAEPKAHSLLSHPHILAYHSCWIQLEPYSEQEKNELKQEEPFGQSEFEMVVFDESNNSDEIVFGRTQSQSSKKIEFKPQQRQKNTNNNTPANDGTNLKDYKEIKIYLLSELCHENLQDFIAQRNISIGKGRTNEDDSIRNYRMALQIVRGLSYLHSKRIIHRDMKLHNIMLDTKGRCKIIDFGLAKKVKHWKTSIDQVYVQSRQEDNQEKYSSSVGTRLFSSPEQANSQNYDYRTDIYSLGIVIALLFSNYTTVHQQRQLLDQIRKRNLEDIAFPSPLRELIYRCLGAQNERPALSQLQKCLKGLMTNIIPKKNLEYQQKKQEIKASCETVIIYEG